MVMKKQVQEEWRVYGKKADFSAISQKFHISPVTARLLRNRDICTDEEIRSYLYGTLDNLPDPLLMKDLSLAVDLLLSAIQNKQRIRIVGDYDADGVCSITVLYRCLTTLHADVDWTIPDRIRDGYGLNMSFVEEAARDGISLLLTCDNGIAALDPITRAKELGMTVIVTDHHELVEQEQDGELRKVTPCADAVVNPKQPDCAYPYRGMCGAGIAWMLTGVLLTRVQYPHIRELQFELLQYAAIATITDVCDLTGVNRILVREGLALLSRSTHPGLTALMKYQQIHPENLSAYHIGFILGPALNAGGRLDTARTAVCLLLAETEAEGDVLAARLKELNDLRKDMTLRWTEKAYELVETTDLANDRVLVVYLPECHESLAGIIAGRIRELFGKPTIVLTNGKNGLKGSARSIEGYHMFQGLVSCREFLTKFGGHPMAAGLSLPMENLQPFRRAINERCSLTDADLVQKVWIDVPLPFEHITMPLIREFTVLEPFGKANPKPVFGERSLEVLSMRILGKNQNVLKLTLRNASGCQMEGVTFENISGLVEEMRQTYGEHAVDAAMRGQQNPIRLTVTYYPEIDTYGGREKLQVVLTRCRIVS